MITLPPLSQTDQIFIGLIIGTILSFIIGGIRALYRRYRPPASVSPKTVVPKAAPQNPASFIVENKTADMLFNVAIKLNPESLPVSTEGIDINTDARKGLSKEEISNLMDDYDFVRLDGTDSSGKESIMFVIRRLVPQTPTAFFLKLPEGTASQDSDAALIRLSMVHQSKTPDEKEYPFNPPKFNRRGDPRLIRRNVDRSLLAEPTEV